MFYVFLDYFNLKFSRQVPEKPNFSKSLLNPQSLGI
jgi:hypothetical protein